MKFRCLLIAALPAFFLSFGNVDDPIGWKLLKETIEKTKFSDISKLKDRTFDLEVPGGTDEYELSLEPKEAFKVERLSASKFRATIVNPKALIKEGLIVEYHPIGWNLRKKDAFKPQITGEANCLYNVIFSQPGVGDLDLSKFDNEYDVTYELSNPSSVSSITRQGRGYDIVRAANSSAESKIRLHIKKKIGDFSLQTDWISIPACGGTQLPPKETTPDTPAEPEESPKDLLDVKIDAISFCDDNGQYCTTLDVIAKNIGSRRVRCNEIWFNMKYEGDIIASQSHWVDLNPGSSVRFQVILKSAFRPASKWTYNIRKTDCSFKF